MDETDHHLLSLLRQDARLSVAALAQKLDVSRGTVSNRIRRLEDEGSSFQAIKDALRHDLAISRLAKTAQPLEGIAADLGFADASAFYRAFVKWTGMAPAHYRRRLRIADGGPG